MAAAEAIDPNAKLLLEYLSKHNVTEKLNRLVNDLAKEQPEDPFSWLAANMSKLGAAPLLDKLVGREVLDSRGNPTVQVDAYAVVGGKSKFIARGTAPSGASTGSNEAHEMRDGDKTRYLGKGTSVAVNNVDTVLSIACKGLSPLNLTECDRAMCKADGTELKTTVGGNAVTAASFAVAEAGAILKEKYLWQHLAESYHGEEKVPEKYSLPVPLVNILNGGKHAGGELKLQEFMIVPKRGISFKEALRHVDEVYHHLGKLLAAKYGPSAKNLGDEGGYAPQLSTAEEAIGMIEEAIKDAGFEAGKDIFLALDCAASEFYDREEKKQYEVSKGKWLTSDQMVDFYADLVAKHPALISIEDGLDEHDYDGWIKLQATLGDKVQLVGDDLFTTNVNLIRKGIEGKWANALLLKVNQIGTITESMDAAKLMFHEKHNVIVSHRSGEDANSLIADLAVAIGAQYIKTGATARGERIAKYNRLLQIEEELQALGQLQL